MYFYTHTYKYVNMCNTQNYIESESESEFQLYDGDALLYRLIFVFVMENVLQHSYMYTVMYLICVLKIGTVYLQKIFSQFSNPISICRLF